MSKETQKPKYGTILEWLADLEDRVGRLEEVCDKDKRIKRLEERENVRLEQAGF